MISSIRRQSGFILTLAIALVTLAPVFSIVVSGFQADPDLWQHLKDYVLADLVKNTVLLVSGVLLTTSVLGVSLAWLTSFYDFYGRKLFEHLLILPLAIPAYVMAFIYTGLLDFSGPVQTFFRAHWPEAAGVFPQIRSAWGVIMVISFAIFPYVFLMAASGFRSMGKTMVEAAQASGAGRIFILFRVTLPMARPWIFGGLILVFMETLADFGAVSVFNYDTFTTGVYKAWYGFFSINSAAQLASILVLIVLVIFLIESRIKRDQRFFNKGGHQAMVRKPLSRSRAILASGVCTLVFTLTFGIPVAQLAIWAASSLTQELGPHYLRLLTNTFSLGILGTLVTMGGAVVLAYAGRAMKDRKTGLAAKLSLAGYALPGTVLAVGIIQVVAAVDNTVLSLLNPAGLQTGTRMLQGSLLLLPVCYLVRFLTAGYNPVFSHLTRLTASMDEAARLMKVTGIGLLTRVHLPLIKKGLATGSILVLVEIIKEMPVTLMLRPFGWDTLAVKIYELTSEGEWERAALPAITLVLTGMVPVILLAIIGRSKS